MITLSNDFPDINLTKDRIYDHFFNEMMAAEQLSNPLSPFLTEIQKYITGKEHSSFIDHDNRYVYLNLPGFWNEMKQSIKNKHYRGKDHKYIKKLLIESEYIARYGIDYECKDTKLKGEQIVSVQRKINSKNQRCFVLLKKNILG